MSATLATKTVAELKAMVANAEKILAGPNAKMHRSVRGPAGSVSLNV